MYRTQQNPKGGMTLLELTFAMALLGVLAGSVGEFVRRASNAYETSMVLADLETRNARVMDRMLREIATASSGSLSPADPDGGAQIDFIAPVGTTGTSVDWGPLVRFMVEPAPGEIFNDLDDNGDGLIDEGVLVRIEDPGGPDERRTVLARNVAELLEGELASAGDNNGNGLEEEGGFAVTVQSTPSATALTLRLTMQRVGRTGRLFERTLTATVVLSNG